MPFDITQCPALVVLAARVDGRTRDALADEVSDMCQRQRAGIWDKAADLAQQHLLEAADLASVEVLIDAYRKAADRAEESLSPPFDITLYPALARQVSLLEPEVYEALTQELRSIRQQQRTIVWSNAADMAQRELLDAADLASVDALIEDYRGWARAERHALGT